jgi:hypothetical protein
MTYEETMRRGAAEYADVLDALLHAGLPGHFTQTGGMCAAIEIQLEADSSLLITEADDTLCWDRQQHASWGVGFYGEWDDLPSVYLESTEGDLDSVMTTIERVLAAAASARPQP